MLKPTKIPQLKAKLDLLLVQYDLLAKAIVSQDDPEQSIDPGGLTRAHQKEQLPTHFIRALLGLYGLRCKEKLDPANPEHGDWFSLIQEPDLDAFVARVRLMGGEVDTSPPGAHWERFLRERLHLALDLGSECVHFTRLDRASMRHSANRGMFVDDPRSKALAPRRTDIPLLKAGERVSLSLGLGTVLKPRPQVFHLFCFLDVRNGNERRAFPILPAPSIEGIVLPPTFSEDSVVEIPEKPSKTNCLLIDRGLDERAYVILVTDRELDAELLEDSRDEDEILPERLDLLAARLQDSRHWEPDRWALIRKAYRVQQEPDTQPPQAG